MVLYTCDMKRQESLEVRLLFRDFNRRKLLKNPMQTDISGKKKKKTQEAKSTISIFLMCNLALKKQM